MAVCPFNSDPILNSVYPQMAQLDITESPWKYVYGQISCEIFIQLKSNENIGNCITRVCWSRYDLQYMLVICWSRCK